MFENLCVWQYSFIFKIFESYTLNFFEVLVPMLKLWLLAPFSFPHICSRVLSWAPKIPFLKVRNRKWKSLEFWKMLMFIPTFQHIWAHYKVCWNLKMSITKHFNMFHYIIRHVETTMLTTQVEILKNTFRPRLKYWNTCFNTCFTRVPWPKRL